MGDGIRVLHVDDETDFLERTARYFEREHERLTVETATSAGDGLDQLTDDIDCVISEYDMPGMDGITFLEAVRERDPTLPFILFTGEGSEAVASEGISAGVTDYLQKTSGTEQYELLCKQIENAVSRRRARTDYQELFKKTPVGLTMHDPETGVIIDANQTFGDLLGYDPDELVGTHPGELSPEGSPFDRETATRLVQKTIETGRQQFEWQDQTKTGDVVWVEVTCERATIDGQQRVLAAARETTAQKKREQELEQREEKLIRLRDYTQELTYAETPAETANIALRAVDEILGFDLGAVFSPSETQEGALEAVEVLDRPRMEKMYGGLPVFLRDAPSGTHSALAWDVFETGESVFINDTAESETLTRKSPFGSLMMYPIDRHGIVLLAATRMDAFAETEEILLDLLATALETSFDRLERERDLRHQRDQLQRQNERLDEFVSVVSHDLRNPLNVATGRLHLASEDCDSDHIDEVAGALDRMSTLIDDLLSLAREGEPSNDLEPVALADIAEACWESVPTEDAALVVETDTVVRADRSRLQQLFENLVRNAIEHAGTDVTITVGDDGDGFYLADDGPGIPEAECESVFETGYSTTEDNTGFGLNIVQEIVAAHGGEVDVTESEDGGARFEITDLETVE